MKQLIYYFILFIFLGISGAAQTGNHITGVSEPFFIPSEKKITCKVGDNSIIIKVFQYGISSDKVFINLHDNESTSVDAARAILEKTGGTLIKIENRKQRVIRFKISGVSYGFDPNRIYSADGIGQTLRDNRRYNKTAAIEAEKFAAQLLQVIGDSVCCVIALHNNYDGAFSVNSYLPGGERQSDARAVYANSLQDADDIAFTTDSLLYQKMADAGFNSIWQDNEKVKKDGSLSVYCGERNIRYINIETQHGKQEQYKVMLEKLLMILDEEKQYSLTADGNDSTILSSF